MHLHFVISVFLFSVATGTSILEWYKFKRDFNKHYASAAEETVRQQIFYRNTERMRTYKHAHPNLTFTLDINHLADRRIEELVLRPKTSFEVPPALVRNITKLKNYPDSLDWRTKGVVTPVLQQTIVSGVAAIVSVELVESLHAIQTGQLVSGSVCRVTDCCPHHITPFECIAKLGGICREADYPASTGECLPNQCQPFAHFNKINTLETRDEDTMIAWIQDSLLYVGIDASQDSFLFYTGGIYQDSTCSQIAIDHVMQVVGYGKSDTGERYWLCKNSWGLGWGERGYARILRGKNMCGIADLVIQLE